MQQMVKCPSCGRGRTGPQFCTTCGARLPVALQQEGWAARPAPRFCTRGGAGFPVATQQEVGEPQPAPVAKPAPRETAPTTKYGALRAVATVYRIIGWVLMVGGTIFSIALAVIEDQGTGAV